jgi:two-component system, response regulator
MTRRLSTHRRGLNRYSSNQLFLPIRMTRQGKSLRRLARALLTDIPSERNPQDVQAAMEVIPSPWGSHMDTKRMILLVEDNDVDAELASRAFQRAEIRNPLVRVRDGLEALDYLFARGKHAARDAYDLPVFALVDLNIPKISGLEVLKAIRADQRTMHLPVIVLSSSGEERDRMGAYKHFANSYIIKPLDYDEFVSATRQLSLYWAELNAPAPLVSADSYDST